MDINSVFFGRSKLIGSEVLISGYLKSDNDTFLVDNNLLLSESERLLLLPNNEIQELLFDQVPVYVGGTYLYSDKCEVLGILVEVGESNNLAVEAKEIKIFREEIFIVKI